MKNLVRKLTATALAVMMLLTIVQLTAAAQTVVEEQDPLYLPLRMVFESDGATVHWDWVNRCITVSYEDTVFEFVADSRQATIGGEAVDLNFPVVLEGGRARISYLDVGSMFVDQDGVFDSAIMTAVISAYAYMDAFSIPGVSIAIVDAENGLTWTRGFGHADLRNNIYVDGDTLFGVGSISKTVTAIAVMQLVEKGLIGLDEPIVKCLPGFSIDPSPDFGGDYKKITARMLLTHTSGIMPNFLGYSGTTYNTYNAAFFDSFLELLAKYFMVTPEGAIFTYNNNGFNLLGFLVAAMAGDDDYFDDFVSYTEENIFKPAGMTRSTFTIGSSLMPYLAKPYVNADTPGQLILMNGLPAGGLFSTANDMARYMHILLNDDGKLLAKGTVGQMMKLHDFDFSTSLGGLGYGLGFMHQTGMDGFQTVGHGGAIIHYYSEMSFNLDSSLGVFVTVNSMTGLQAASAMANAILQTAVMEKTGTLKLLPSKADPDATPATLSAEELAGFAGLYVGTTEYYLMDVGEDGVLYMHLPTVPDFPPLPLTPMSDGSFDSMIGRLWFELIVEDEEQEMVLRMGNMNFHMIAARVVKENFLPGESFVPWIGTFISQPAENEASLVSAFRFGIDGFGIANMESIQIMGVTPAAPVSAADKSWLMGFENIVYDDDGAVLSFQVMGMRFIRLAI